MVLSIEAIPLGILISLVFPGWQPDAALRSPLRRRSRFWLRFAAVVIAMLLPDLVAILAPLGEQAAGAMLWSGFLWGLLLLVASRFVLFHRSGPDLGPGGEDGDGPDPGDDRPTPPAPIGGIPLPDAEPSSTRVRDHRPPRPARRSRRPLRERERFPSRLWPLRLRPSWRHI